MDATPPKPLLLFVDDEPDIVDIARMCFETSGWSVVTAHCIAAAKLVLARDPVDAVLSDIMMRGGSGLELLEWVREHHGRDFLFFLLTGCIDERVAHAMSRGAHGVFNKPCDWQDVIDTLSGAVYSAARRLN